MQGLEEEEVTGRRNRGHPELGGDAQEASESGSQGGGWEEGRAGAQSLQGLGGPGEELGLFSPWNLQMLEP